MQLTNARILLTGATGGLGEALARAFAAAGAQLLLSGRNAERLALLAAELGPGHSCVIADLDRAEGIAAAVGAACEFRIDVLVNNAGIGAFGCFELADWDVQAAVLATNLVAPMRLTHGLLPWLRSRPEAAIVNVGSTFGSLPFPGFAAYSAAKAGLRGFSQALRRELADSAITVMHVSPRVIETAFNSPAVNALNDELRNGSDSPEWVAHRIVEGLERGQREIQFGFPERLFAWLNGVAPSLIDRGLANKLPIVKRHAFSARD